ncbi:MAG: primase, partial [Frankiales bacterium]|nr:primase [Frankiales bacterium]
RVPLVEFAVRSALSQYDLETSEGRVQALATAAPMVAKIKDRALRPEYARRLAGWLGMEVEVVTSRVGELTGEGRAPAQRRPGQRPVTRDEAAQQVEREAVKLAVQLPVLVAPLYDDLDLDVFTDPRLAAVHRLVMLAGGTSGQAGGEAWVSLLREVASDDDERAVLAMLAVEPLRYDGEPDQRYAVSQLQRLQELAVTRQIAELKPKLQRVSPEAQEYNRLFAELISLEQTVRALRESAVGDL